MFYLVREFSYCTEFCVLTRKWVVKVAVLFEVVTCNSFEVLTRVMLNFWCQELLPISDRCRILGNPCVFQKPKKTMLRTLASRWITNLWRVRILEYTHVP